MSRRSYRETGIEAIAQGGHGNDMLPFHYWTDFFLRGLVEYPVADFASEVGFMADVFGFEFGVLSADYAICTDAGRSFSFSFKARAGDQPDLADFRLQFFVNNLDEIAAILDVRGEPHTVSETTSDQRIIHLSTPAGMPVEIWSGAGDGERRSE